MHRSTWRHLLLVSALVVLLAACDWPMLGGDPARTGTTGDTSIALASLSSLTAAWTTGTDFTASATAKGHVWSRVGVYDAAGVTGCAGSPKVCTPVWTNAPAPTGAWAVVGGIAYNVRVSSPPGNDRLQAFDAAGERNCAGSPKVCAPLWEAPVTGLTSPAPAVAGGTVFVAGEGGLLAFDAKTGARRWKGVTPARTARGVPAVADGVVTIGDAGDLFAFDAAGSSGCVPAFAACAPLWRGVGGQGGGQAMANGSVYVVTATGLEVFDAAGTANCAGSPKVCAPVWTAPGAPGNDTNVPAVTPSTVYVASTYGVLLAFDAKGEAGCGGTPKTCTAQWTADLGADLQTGHVRMQPSVVNGLLFIGFHGAAAPPTTDDRLVAFDAHGAFGCVGSPKRCVPVWGATAPGLASGQVSVADRRVVVGRFTFQLG